MSAKNFSHASCDHASTKVARAKCRREMARSIAALVSVATVVTESPIITAWNSMKTGPLELLPAPVRTDVTAENWREFKGQTVSVDLIGETVEGEITGWSAKNVQIKTDGKTVRHPVSIVIRATV
ncbi:hypothetical protein PP631_gp098 [Streptomyces phage KimJongPhill]|uniref:Uncharacterized protein n=1 Tax=Streptomyces phage KimJongPhill TaxID=2848886 RepID=A0A8F2IW40_9CAUD|nr:hypothetical protein PP631_gp098 [Streptomyces phage KimJongPhill]QWT29879.1 hypothetical protein SEA_KIMJONGPHILL_98 [Streptomyces phage KimJongPhill]